MEHVPGRLNPADPLSRPPAVPTATPTPTGPRVFVPLAGANVQLLTLGSYRPR